MTRTKVINEKQASVKDWYLKEYPTDEFGEYLNDEITFEDIIIGMYFREDFYKIAFNDGHGDSLVRERIFSKLAEMYGVDYGIIYDMWLGDKENKISLKRDFGIVVAFC